MTIETEIVSWRDDAACIDSKIDFFPNPEDVAAITAAQEIFSTCPGAQECRTKAHETPQSEGIWGGHTPKERVKIRRKWSEQVRRAS